MMSLKDAGTAGLQIHQGVRHLPYFEGGDVVDDTRDFDIFSSQAPASLKTKLRMAYEGEVFFMAG
jgi:hypothetical protein